MYVVLAARRGIGRINLSLQFYLFILSVLGLHRWVSFALVGRAGVTLWLQGICSRRWLLLVQSTGSGMRGFSSCGSRALSAG